MLSTRSLSFQYERGPLLSFPDMEFATGEHSLILGQSGCGKTTLLHLLGGLRSPHSGEIVIDGKHINNLSASALDGFRGQHIGIIFQKSHFVKALNVRENLMLAQKFAGKPIDRARIHDLLERLGISNKEEKKTTTLSQGEQQRVAIARAIINNPSLILADEPTSALDDKNTDEVINLLVDQASQVNATLLVVTHDNRLKSRFTKRVLL